MASNADKIRTLKQKQQQWMLERAQTIDRVSSQPRLTGASSTSFASSPSHKQQQQQQEPQQQQQQQQSQQSLHSARRPQQHVSNGGARSLGTKNSTQSSSSPALATHRTNGYQSPAGASAKPRSSANGTNASKRQSPLPTSPNPLLATRRETPSSGPVPSSSQLLGGGRGAAYGGSHVAMDGVANGHSQAYSPYNGGSSAYNNGYGDGHNASPAAVHGGQPDDADVDEIAGRIADRLKLGIRDVLTRESRAAANRTEELAAKMETYIAAETAMYSCPVCEKVMAGAANVPTVVIPCGHTFCEACLGGHARSLSRAQGQQELCPLCRTPIQSRGRNTALMQTIDAFVRRSRQLETDMAPATDAARAMRYSRIVAADGFGGNPRGSNADAARGLNMYDAYSQPGSQRSGGQYSSANYGGSAYGDGDAPNVRAHEQAVRYQSEYRSYSMRCRILQNEYTDGRNACVTIDSRCADLGRAEQALEGEEESVARQIAALERQRADIRSRRDEKKREIDALRQEKDALRKRLSVVRDTLVPLRVQRDKAKLILGNLDASAGGEQDSESDCDLSD